MIITIAECSLCENTYIYAYIYVRTLIILN